MSSEKYERINWNTQINPADDFREIPGHSELIRDRFQSGVDAVRSKKIFIITKESLNADFGPPPDETIGVENFFDEYGINQEDSQVIFEAIGPYLAQWLKSELNISNFIAQIEQYQNWQERIVFLSLGDLKLAFFSPGSLNSAVVLLKKIKKSLPARNQSEDTVDVVTVVPFSIRQRTEKYSVLTFQEAIEIVQQVIRVIVEKKETKIQLSTGFRDFIENREV